MKTGPAIVSAAFFLLLAACTSPERENKNSGTLEKQLSIGQYSSRLAELPSGSPAPSLEALELFTQRVNKSNPDSNDAALKTFLDFQNKLADSLNKRLMTDTAFSSCVNSLIYLDSSLYEAEDLEFEKKILSYGFRLRRAEGSVYLVSNPDLIKKHFYDYLSEGGQAFLSQYGEEVYQPFASDAALIIPVQELGKRTIFWEKFSDTYPKSPFKEYASKQYSRYLYFLMAGMDNTPAFSDGKLSNEFFYAHEKLIKEYPDSKTAGILRDYQEVLSQNNYSHSAGVRQFLEKFHY